MGAARLVGAGLLAVAAVAGAGGCAAVDGALAGSAPQPVRDAGGAIVEEGDVDAMSLLVGDCLVHDATSDVVEVWTVHVTPCTKPHDAEVYAVTDMADGEFPGEKVVTAEADEFCYGEFGRFVGLPWEASELDFTVLFPTATSWDQLGDRELLCMVDDPAGGVVGSLAGAER